MWGGRKKKRGLGKGEGRPSDDLSKPKRMARRKQDKKKKEKGRKREGGEGNETRKTFLFVNSSAAGTRREKKEGKAALPCLFHSKGKRRK